MFTDPTALTLALILAFIAVAVLAYEAGSDAGKRAKWEAEVQQSLDLVAQAGSRSRHPGGRDAA
jgi:cbb3-type cytochrome oxidase subunit 3